MSTQLMDPPQADEVTGEFAPSSAPLTDGVSFDRATRQRLLVAEAAADTLESLSDTRAWDRLDPAVQAHLLAQSGRLRDHVRHLGSQRAVRSVEDAALRLKRLERRLEIAVESLEPADAGSGHAAGLFLGDFTEIEPDERPAGPKTARKEPKKTSRARALTEGVHRFRTRAERAAAAASSRRITLYVVAGVLVTGAALLWNFKETYSQGRVIQKPPSAGFKMDAHLQDMRAFFPATQTVLRDRDIRVVVGKDWLLRTEAQRRIDAESAHVWLANRNVTSMLLTWDDGTPLARYAGGQGSWYDMTQPGKKLGVPEAGP